MSDQEFWEWVEDQMYEQESRKKPEFIHDYSSDKQMEEEK